MHRAFVTGAARGIGRATALALASAGYEVTATVRSAHDAADLEEHAQRRGLSVTTVVLDVTDTTALQTMLARLSDPTPLDLVVFNAGQNIGEGFESASLDQARALFEVNVLSIIAGLQEIIPQMRKAGGGRVIALSSISGVVGLPFQELYSATKFAVEGLFESLAGVAGQWGIHLSVIEPGAVATDMVALDVADEPPSDAYELARARYVASLDRSLDATQTPEEIAAFILGVAAHPAPALRYQTSPLARSIIGLKLLDLDGTSVSQILTTWGSGAGSASSPRQRLVTKLKWRAGRLGRRLIMLSRPTSSRSNAASR